MCHEYETLVRAADSIAHKNGVDIGTAMLWAKQNVADGCIVITGKIKEQSTQISLIDVVIT
jgi:hypothetical protein